MLNQIECQNQEITEKIGAMKALKEEMDKVETLFEEVSNELSEKNAELEATTTKLTETENTLECTKVVLEKTAYEREEQKHLVEKHVETESHLKEQANKLLETSEISSKDLKLVHDKLDRIKTVDEANLEAKGDFKVSFQHSVEEIMANLSRYGSGHEKDCSNLQRQLQTKLNLRVEKLSSLSETLTQMIKDQVKTIDEISDMREAMKESELKHLDKEKEKLAEVVAANESKVKRFHTADLAPILKQMLSSLRDQAKELNSLEKTVTTDVQTMVQSVKTFADQVVEDVGNLKNSVDTYSSSNEARIENLQARNQEIYDSEKNFKTLLNQLMASYSEHEKLVSSNTQLIDEASSADVEDVKHLVDKSQAATKQLNEMQAMTIKNMEKENEKIISNVKSTTENCDQINKNIETCRNEFAKVVEKHIEETKTSWNIFKHETETESEAQRMILHESTSRFEEYVAQNKSDVIILGNSVVELIEEVKTHDAVSVEKIVDSVGELESNGKEMVECTESLVAQREEEVQRFLSEVLQEDKPTGLTPARVERNYPRILAATSPHERILNRQVSYSFSPIYTRKDRDRNI